MTLRLVMAAVAVVAVPVALYGQEPAPVAPAKSERRVCETTVVIGSRLGHARRCYSKSEHDAMKQESRRVVDRVQALKIHNNVDNIPGRLPPVGRPPR